MSICFQKHTLKDLQSQVFRLIRGSNCFLFTLVWVLCCVPCVMGQITGSCLLLCTQNSKCQQLSGPGVHGLTCLPARPSQPHLWAHSERKESSRESVLRGWGHNAVACGEKVQVVESKEKQGKGIRGREQVGEMGVRNKGTKEGEQKEKMDRHPPKCQCYLHRCLSLRHGTVV